MASRSSRDKYSLQDTLCTLVDSFIKRVKAGEWRSLQLGEPDEETKIKIAKLLIDFISLASAGLLTFFTNLNVVSEECVVSSLNTSLPEIFAELLDVNIKCIDSEKLTALIAKDITENINSALSSRQDSQEPIFNRVTPACRLDVLVQLSCKMLKPHGSKVKLFLVQPRRDVCPCIKPRFVQKQADPAVLRTKVSVKLNQITKPLVFDMSNTEFKQLQAETSLKPNSYVDIVMQSITDEVGPQGTTDPKKHWQCVQKTEEKLKTFCAIRFTKASVLNTVAKLRTEFDTQSKQDTKSLMHSFDDLLQTYMYKNQGKIDVTKKFSEIANGKNPAFTQALTDLIYHHINRSSQPDAAMLVAIRTEVLGCLGLTSWWMKTVIRRHSEDVTSALKDSEPEVIVQLPEVLPVQVTESRDCSAAESAPQCETAPVIPTTDAVTEKRKWFIRIFIDRFVSRLLRKSKVRLTFVTIQAIVRRLFEKTWAEVKDTDFKDSDKTFKKMEKSIFKELVKKCGSEPMLINSLKIENPEIEDYISSSVKRHITQPKKLRTISKVFTAARGFSFR